ncbi:malonyl-CoA decarboxylase [Ideonella paludis]|uniref:malonyl-CoA decarboxylase n=1 Tax=Ideonella paludis TaxID=1233411 RepID=UPI001FE42E6C|nr:malonyl-CoA decarboxylase [Ideonella paludis]
MTPQPPIARGKDRALTALVRECHRLLSEQGVANGVALAQGLLQRLSSLADEQAPAFFKALAEDFNPNPAEVLTRAQAYAHSATASNLMALSEAAEPPRQELLRRLNKAPGGTAAIVRLRQRLLKLLPKHPELQAVEADLLHLLSSWFNPGFLQLVRVDWNTPAQLLEQVIRHEAVHEIDGWDDLRRRLQPDRRCFAFFHPQLPDEPLIFVEVALLPEMPGAIAPLIDKASPTLAPSQFKVATFYSISNCQPGLRGVSLGNFLIKRVAQELQRELPQLKTFCTLSPIPGFMAWLQQGRLDDSLAPLSKAVAQRLRLAHQQVHEACAGELSRLTQADTLPTLPAELQDALHRLCAHYLVHVSPQPHGDPVARFHLDNGARLERINPQGNLSARGRAQAAGMMVNYLYDLAHIEARHQAFTQGEVAHARAVSRLL